MSVQAQRRSVYLSKLSLFELPELSTRISALTVIFYQTLESISFEGGKIAKRYLWSAQAKTTYCIFFLSSVACWNSR